MRANIVINATTSTFVRNKNLLSKKIPIKILGNHTLIFHKKQSI